MELKSVGIVGFGSYTPEKIMTNADFEKIVDTTDEWIRTRTGIEERRYAAPEQATSDLCVEAAKKALESAKLSANDLDLIIVATCTPDHLFPSTSCLVQKKLGASSAAAFDLNAACTGFVYALNVANGLVKANIYKKILVIGGETLSRIANMKDRSTCVLFGDGAAAAVVQEVEKGTGILSAYLGADGDLNETLWIGIGTKQPMTPELLEAGHQFLHMKGQEVFKFAVTVLPKATEEALTQAGLKTSDIDLVIPHQANSRIVEAAAKKLGIPLEKFFMNLNKYGNTSSASIGIALDEQLRAGKIKKGDIIVLTGFGGGLTYGSMVIKWSF
ncbi:MAG: beta-ketoacyl-ACP synthase III [Fusobacteriaceae bacterium]